MPRSYAPLAAALFVAALAAVAIAGALVLPLGSLRAPEAGFMPLVESALLALFAVALIVDSLRRGNVAAVEWPTGEPRTRVLGTGAALVAYVALLPVAGFAAATFLFLWFAIAWWRRRSPLRCAAYAAAIALILHLLFAVTLRMSLPAGWW